MTEKVSCSLRRRLGASCVVFSKFQALEGNLTDQPKDGVLSRRTRRYRSSCNLLKGCLCNISKETVPKLLPSHCQSQISTALRAGLALLEFVHETRAGKGRPFLASICKVREDQLLE